MKKIISIVILMTMVLSSIGTSITAYAKSTATVKVSGTYMQSDARKMLGTINSFRTGKDAWYYGKNNKTKVKCKKLGKLKYSYKLEKVAMQRAAEIALKYAHERPNGKMCNSLYPKGLASWWGENLTMGCNMSMNDAMKSWREDNEKYSGQGHRRNMLSDKYKTVAIGHFRVGRYDFWVQEFSGDSRSFDKTSAKNSKTTVKVEAVFSLKPVTSRLLRKVSKDNSKVIFVYNHPGYISAYQYQVSDNKSFKNAKTITVKNVDKDLVLSNLNRKKTNYIRCRAVLNVGNKKNYGPYETSKISPPKTPKVNPVDNTGTVIITPIYPKELKIESRMRSSASLAVACYGNTVDAVSFEYQCSASDNFTAYQTKTMTRNNNGAQYAAQFNNLEPDTTYYFRVRAIYKNSKSSWSKVYNLKTSPINPNRCTTEQKFKYLILPEITRTTYNTKSDVCKYEFDNAISSEGFELQVADNPNFEHAVTYTTTNKYCEVSSQKNKTFYARVRAYKTFNGSKAYSQWSEIRINFYIGK